MTMIREYMEVKWIVKVVFTIGVFECELKLQIRIVTKSDLNYSVIRIQT